jgi:hypothetical protein
LSKLPPIRLACPRLAPLRSAPHRSALNRSASDRLAPDRLAPPYSPHTQEPRLRWPLLLTPRDSKNPCPAAQGGLLQVVGPSTPLRRLALAGGLPCYIPRSDLGRVGNGAAAAVPEQGGCHPKRQAHLLASGNGVLIRRRQASGRPLQQGHLPLRMPRQAGEDRRSQVWVSEPPWTRA